MPKEKTNSNQIHCYRCKRFQTLHGCLQEIITILEWAEINILKWSNNKNYLKLRMTPNQFMPRVLLKSQFFKIWQLSTKNHQEMQVCNTARWILKKICHRVTTITIWTLMTPMIPGIIQFKIHFCHQSTFLQDIQMKDLWCIMTLITLDMKKRGKELQISQGKRIIIKVLVLVSLF